MQSTIRRSPRTAPRALRGALAALALILLSGCGETGQERVSVPLYLGGAALGGPVEAAGGVSVTLDRAALAFGPLYLCAGEQAGELCDTARLEWLGSAVVDVLSAEPVAVGALGGVSGTVRSYMFDYGLSSVLTHAEPLVLDAARELDGASLSLDGVASTAGGEVPFTASVAVRQQAETEQGVPVVRRSSSERFEHRVTAHEPGLVVRFDARRWLGGIDFTLFQRDARCEPGGPSVACTGRVEDRCAASGAVASTRDCSARGQLCQSGVGCVDRVAIEDGSPGYQSLVTALVSGTRPSFDFGGP